MKKTAIIIASLFIAIQIFTGCSDDDDSNGNDGYVPTKVTIEIPEGL